MRQERDYSRVTNRIDMTFSSQIPLWVHTIHCVWTNLLRLHLFESCQATIDLMSAMLLLCMSEAHIAATLSIVLCVWAVSHQCWQRQSNMTRRKKKTTALNPELLCSEMFGDSWQALEVLWTYNHSKMWCSFHKIYVCRTADWCLLLLVHARRKTKIKHKWRRTFGVHLCLLTCLLVYK